MKHRAMKGEENVGRAVLVDPRELHLVGKA